MAVVVETIDAAGNLVEIQEAGGQSTSEPAAPPPEAPGDSAPPVPEAAPPAEAPSGDSAPPAVHQPEDDDTDTRDVPRGVQKRFDTLTRRASEAQRHAQELQQRYDRDLAELRGQLEMQTKLLRGEQPARESLPLHQQPEPIKEDYPDDERWFNAVREWDRAQTLREFEQRQYQQAAQAEEQRHQQAMQAREAIVRAQHADYGQQISTLGAKGMTPQVYQALMAHELGPDLGYYLAQHPDELSRLAPLPPLQVWRELGKLEVRLEGNGSGMTQGPGTPSVVTSSQPKPAPLTPVGSGGSGAPTVRLDDPNVPQRDWEAEAERQYPGIFGRRR